MENTHARFEATAELMAAALARLGVDARVGEVPREYCPGAYSVNAGGRRKLVGVGQRVIARAAHVGGVIIVAQSERVRAVLEPVYRALGLDWDPATAGAVDDELGDVTYEQVEAAILAEYAHRYELVETPLDEDSVGFSYTLNLFGFACAPARASEHRIVERGTERRAAGSFGPPGLARALLSCFQSAANPHGGWRDA